MWFPKCGFMRQQQRKRQFHSGTMVCGTFVLCSRSTEGCIKPKECTLKYMKTIRPVLCRTTGLWGRSTKGCLKPIYCSLEYIKTTGIHRPQPGISKQFQASRSNHDQPRPLWDHDHDAPCRNMTHHHPSIVKLESTTNHWQSAALN